MSEDAKKNHLITLRKLQQSAELQKKEEIAEALAAAVAALEDQEDSRGSNDETLPLSNVQAQTDQLASLTRDVRLSTSGSAERKEAVKRLTSLAGSRNSELPSRSPAEHLASLAKGGE